MSKTIHQDIFGDVSAVTGSNIRKNPMFLKVNYTEDRTRVSQAFLISTVQEHASTAEEHESTNTLAWTIRTRHDTLTTPEMHDTVPQTNTPKIDVGLISSICLSTLVVLNIAFTLLFYFAWRKRKIKTPAILITDGRQTPHLGSIEELNPYRTIEIFDNPDEGTYVNSGWTNQSKDAESLYDSIGSRNTTYCSLEAVEPRENSRRDKFKTLTTLFNIHSQDVNRTVFSLTRKDVSEQ